MPPIAVTRMNENHHPAAKPEHHHAHRTLPDPALCRAKQIAASLVDCLVHNASHCRHALRFGHGQFCQHPESQEIVKRTEAEKKTKK
ncbi:MAG: hypothetical protein NT105_17050 [Verrucomicrobia bacterium]|nr:hypothetical protein [Verrucomicrobiota bacterium]